MFASARPSRRRWGSAAGCGEGLDVALDLEGDLVLGDFEVVAGLQVQRKKALVAQGFSVASRKWKFLEAVA